MANGQAGECYWTVSYWRDGEPTTYNTAIGGKFPVKTEADAFMPTVQAHFENTEPGVIVNLNPVRICCGKPLPGEV